ncbi:phage holin family protein [Flavobacterium sp. B183]|uniref:phage holin family protein n=1 Tax=Flavobacterium sp. B183 TaxID=907046 RepID=UPI00201E8008|nr:phage holin family protein [Flavobacterium sp. B183]URC12571.1 phage holin family protein [Flavobacterium sp. B183]
MMMHRITEYSNELKLLLYGIFIYLEMDAEIVKVLFYLMVLDTFLGIVKTIVLNNSFSFKKLALGFVSKLAVLLIPTALALMSKGLNYNFKWFVTIVMDLLIVSDSISIISNIIAIKTKKEVENFDAMTLILKSIRNRLIQLFKRILITIDPRYHVEE